MSEEAASFRVRVDECVAVHDHRYAEAIQAGLTITDAELFAGNDQDVGVLRRLVADGCAPLLIGQIVS
jgi:hypothetical protein